MSWNHYRPTPEQIAEACRAIRAEWDEATHRRRWVHPVKGYWTAPLVVLEGNVRFSELLDFSTVTRSHT